MDTYYPRVSLSKIYTTGDKKWFLLQFIFLVVAVRMIYMYLFFFVAHFLKRSTHIKMYSMI